MINITKQDIDIACAAYARAAGEYPRREGIRVALHSFRQLSQCEKDNLKVAEMVLRNERTQPCEAAAKLLRQLFELDSAPQADVSQRFYDLEKEYYGG